MTRFGQWLAHRMEVLGIPGWSDVCAAADLPAEAADDLMAVGNLDVIEDRGGKRRLAAVLRVPLKKLEALDEENIFWIGDDEFYDANTQGLAPPHWSEEKWWEPIEVERPKGTPAVGDIRRNGSVDLDDGWDEWNGPRIPSRLGDGRNVYALRDAGTESYLIFRNAQPFEMRLGQPAALYVLRDQDGVGYVARPKRSIDQRLSLLFSDDTEITVDLADVVRYGRIIGQWSPGAAYGIAEREDANRDREERDPAERDELERAA